MPALERPIVVLDTETATRLHPPHLLEIGAVRVVDGEIVEHFESLVRPQVPIERETSEVHGILDEHVRDAPDAREVLERFARFVGSDWMAAHDARSDAAVIGFECARYGLAAPPGPILDTLALARRLVGEASDHKLATLCQHLDIEVDVRHRALADAVSCWKVLEACLERLDERVPARATVDDGPDGPPSIAPLSARPTGGLSSVVAECGRLRTVAAAAPRAPKLPARLRGLEEALRAGRKVTIAYGEGAPSRLAVLPRLVFEHGGKGYLEAECQRSGLLKTYRLDRVHKLLV